MKHFMDFLKGKVKGHYRRTKTGKMVFVKEGQRAGGKKEGGKSLKKIRSFAASEDAYSMDVIDSAIKQGLKIPSEKELLSAALKQAKVDMTESEMYKLAGPKSTNENRDANKKLDYRFRNMDSKLAKEEVFLYLNYLAEEKLGVFDKPKAKRDKKRDDELNQLKDELRTYSKDLGVEEVMDIEDRIEELESKVVKKSNRTFLSFLKAAKIPKAKKSSPAVKEVRGDITKVKKEVEAMFKQLDGYCMQLEKHHGSEEVINLKKYYKDFKSEFSYKVNDMMNYTKDEGSKMVTSGDNKTHIDIESNPGNDSSY